MTRELKEHGLLFTAPMVRAILAGQKSQTRRPMREQPVSAQVHEWKGATVYDGENRAWCWRDQVFPDAVVDCHGTNTLGPELVRYAPHGPVRRRLWVRETWHQCPHCERVVSYRAGGWREVVSGGPDWAGDRCDDDARPLSPKCEAHGWKPSIHMPRWASRITLEVTRVRVERVGDITMADVRAEGVKMPVAPAGEGKVSPLVQIPTPYAKRMDADWTEADYWRAAYAHLWDEINGAGSWSSNPWVFVYDFRRVS